MNSLSDALRQEFFGLDLKVDAHVLVPRAHTETLVEWALKVLGQTPEARVVDLGTSAVWLWMTFAESSRRHPGTCRPVLACC